MIRYLTKKIYYRLKFGVIYIAKRLARHWMYDHTARQIIVCNEARKKINHYLR